MGWVELGFYPYHHLARRWVGWASELEGYHDGGGAWSEVEEKSEKEKEEEKLLRSSSSQERIQVLS